MKCLACNGSTEALKYDTLCARHRAYHDILTARNSETGELVDQRPLDVIRDEYLNPIPSHWMAL